MQKEVFDYIDNIYEIIFKYNYDYKKSISDLNDLKNEIIYKNFNKNEYYFQLMATLEYFIHMGFYENTPYKVLLPENEQINNYFKKSLNIDQDNPPLRYLYALYKYNTGNFVNAKNQFLEINKQYFIDLDILDRVLKIEELILCCQIFLNKAKETYIIDFLKKIKTLDDYIYPSDLIMTLSYKLEYFTNNVKSEIDNL